MSKIKSFKGRTVNPDKTVKVYRNLHANGDDDKFSIMQDGLIVGHTSELRLHSVKFCVSKAGRARVLAEGRKNVHAFIVGMLSGLSVDSALPVRITYNPHKYETFVALLDDHGTFQTVTNADHVQINSHGVSAANTSHAI